MHPVLHGARAIAPREFLDALKAISPPRFQLPPKQPLRHVGLAVSGGVDSMALAYLCSQLKRIDPFITVSDNPVCRFICLVIDHGLREGSWEEASKVVAVLRGKIKLPADLMKINWELEVGGRPTGSNLETLGRRARFQVLARATKRYCTNMASILLAHHEDDVYETVLMRLLAGASYRGLTGIRAAGDIPDCHGMHGFHQSGFVDDQLRSEPYYKTQPSRRDGKKLRAGLRAEAVSETDAADLRLGAHADLDAFLEDLEEEESYGDVRVPPLEALALEEGGLYIYRPLLEFSKDRLVATCLENGVPWFEDATNADATLTVRNALRRLVRDHALPAALQKPRVLALAARCRARVAAEEAEAVRFLPRSVVSDFEPGAGTVVAQFPTLTLPDVPRIGRRSDERRQKRLGHYRLVAALLVRKIISVVTPEQSLTPPGDLQGVVSRLFPSLATENPVSVPKAFSICGVHFMPLPGARWYLSRAPYSSTVPAPTQIVIKNHIRGRLSLPPEKWKMSPWRWLLWDGRYWVRITHKLPTRIRIGPFEPGSAKAFRDALPPQEKNQLARLLRRYAPAKVRFTLPALYSHSNVDQVMSGGTYWPEVAGGDRNAQRQAMTEFENDLIAQGNGRLLALPTLGIQLPNLYRWLRWEIRYRKVDSDLLRLTAPDASCIRWRRGKRRKQLRAVRVRMRFPRMSSRVRTAGRVLKLKQTLAN